MQYSTYDNLENVTMAGNCIKGTQDPSMLLLDLHENLQLSQEEIFNLKIIISNIFINDVFLNVFLTTAYSYKHVSVTNDNIWVKSSYVYLFMHLNSCHSNTVGLQVQQRCDKFSIPYKFIFLYWNYTVCFIKNLESVLNPLKTTLVLVVLMMMI